MGILKKKINFLGGNNLGWEIIHNGKNGIIIRPRPPVFKTRPPIKYFQPTKIQLQHQNEATLCNLKGRHDPCIAIRGSVVTEAMMAIVLVDMLLLNMGRRVSDIDKIYGDTIS